MSLLKGVQVLMRSHCSGKKPRLELLSISIFTAHVDLIEYSRNACIAKSSIKQSLLVDKLKTLSRESRQSMNGIEWHGFSLK